MTQPATLQMETLGEEITAGTQIVACRHCRRLTALLFADTYTCWEQCLECGHKTLVGWFSYRSPILTPGVV